MGCKVSKKGIQHCPKTKMLSCQKALESDFQSQFLISRPKDHLNLSENYFKFVILIYIGDKFNFRTSLFSKLISNFWRLDSWCYVNFQNTTISLEYVYFWTTIYPSLYPSTKKLITYIAISCNVGTQFREKHQFSIRSTLNTLISIWTNHLSFNLVTLGSVGVVNRRFFSTFSLSPPHLRQSAPCRRLTRNQTSY